MHSLLQESLVKLKAEIEWYRVRSHDTGTGWPKTERDVDRIGREALTKFKEQNDVG